MKVISLFWRKSCLVPALVGFVLGAYGQAPIKPDYGIQIGQSLDPSYLLQAKTVRNGQQSRPPATGSWILLDFWETYCAACIASLPKLDSLQRRFADTVKFIPVTGSSWPLVHKTLSRLRMDSLESLNFIVEDTALNRRFPHAEIPHVVWVDPRGVVKAITGGDQVNESIISRVLSEKEVELTRKQDNLRWDKSKPLGGLDPEEIKPLYRSALLKYNAANGSSISFKCWDGKSNVGQKNHVYISNQGPVQMYYAAFMALTEGSVGSPNPYRISVEIKDEYVRQRYADPDLSPYPFLPTEFPFLEWNDKYAFRKDNSFSYDLMLEHPVPDSLFLEYVLEDLNRFFPFKGSVELRQTECLVLVAEDVQKARETLKSKTLQKSWRIGNESIASHGGTLSEFVGKHLSWLGCPPILDETGITDPVDIEIFFNDCAGYSRLNGLVSNTPWDENCVRNELAKYGLSFKKDKRWVKMLVLKDR
ncbi:hypothetical protein GCM10023091_10940 [Ravibacter arvi]|uniref:Thioredoxin domain-containing protein n=1 Tax=Ravibacter arvi TaxID=2051041 RepID=A0ABP8LRR2_9BACT